MAFCVVPMNIYFSYEYIFSGKMIKKTATPKTENDVYSDWQNPVQLNVVHALFKLLETNVFGRIFKTLTEKELKFFFHL